jgi:gliding motility-associated lipoprotein GldD
MKRQSSIYVIVATVLAALAMASCKPKALPEPKPMGYFRIDLPDHKYKPLDASETSPDKQADIVVFPPFTCEQSVYATSTLEVQPDHCLWMNLTYPELNASLRFTCITVKNADSLRNLMIREDKMVKFHYQMADDVQYSVIKDPEAHIWGQAYEIYGKEVATPFQFWLTDSVHNFVRATLYFDSAPNNDSLQPVIQYLKEDAMHLINTFAWKP